MKRRSRGGGYLLDLEIEEVVVQLVVDTGASMTVLSAEALDRMDVRPDPRRSVTALTANGKTRFATAVVTDITLAERVLDSSRVAVCDGCGIETFADGLLGLDLQAAFGMELDPAGGWVRFRDCRP